MQSAFWKAICSVLQPDVCAETPVAELIWGYAGEGGGPAFPVWKSQCFEKKRASKSGWAGKIVVLDGRRHLQEIRFQICLRTPPRAVVAA